MDNDRPDRDKATKVHLDDVDFAKGLRADEGWIGMKVQFLINEANSGAKEVVFGRTVFAPGSRHEWHRHENAEEIQYVISGGGSSSTVMRKSPSKSAMWFTPRKTNATVSATRRRPMTPL